MKKYDLTFLISGVIFSLVPLYNFFGWVYILNAYSELSGKEKCVIFKSDILFSLFEGQYISSILIFSFGFVGGVLLLLSLLNSIQYKANMKTLKLFFFILNLFSSFWILWGMM